MMNEPHEIQEPEPLPGVGVGEARPRRSVEALLRWSWTLIGLSVAAGVLIVFSTGLVLFLAPLFLWIVPLFALVFASTAGVRLRRTTTAPANPARRYLWAALVVSVLLSLGHIGSCFLVRYRWLEYDLSTVARANLWGIGQALEAYAERHGSFSPSLQTLVSTEMCVPSQLWTTADLESNELPSRYASFVYRPAYAEWAKDPRLVIAFEPESVSWDRFSFFAKLGRLVLFGDGRVQLLNAAEFEKAMHEDAQRRAELVASVPQNRPAIVRATQAARSQPSPQPSP